MYNLVQEQEKAILEALGKLADVLEGGNDIFPDIFIGFLL